MTAAMIIGTGIFGAIGPATAKAGSGIILAMTIGGIVALFTGISAAQLGINYPKEGGAFTWSRELHHETIGFIAGMAYLGKAIFSLSVISLAFAEYSRQLAPTLPIPLLAAGVVLAVLVLNLFHVGLTTKVLIALMMVNVSFLGLYVALAAPAVTVAHFSNPLGDNGVFGVFAGAALFFWTWDGFMRTAIMAGEVRNPRRTIPVAIIGGISIAAVVFLAVGATTLGVLGPQSMGMDNIPLFRAATLAIGVWGGGLILVTAWTASLSELVPGWLGKIHSGARVPRNAVLVLGLVVVGLVSIFDLRSVLAVASVFTLVWYIITHYSALRLRKEQRLTSPLFTWLGLAGCAALFWSLPSWASIVGLTILALLAGARWLTLHYRKNLKTQHGPVPIAANVSS